MRTKEEWLGMLVREGLTYTRCDWNKNLVTLNFDEFNYSFNPAEYGIEEMINCWSNMMYYKGRKNIPIIWSLNEWKENQK